MSTFDQMSISDTVARVRAVEDEGYLLHLELQNGKIATVDLQEPTEFDVGDVVLVQLEENRIKLASDELWQEESWVGVVRLKLPDTTVLYSDGQWKMLKTRTDVEYSEGNTVEARNNYGVVRVLSEKPIRHLDLPTDDENDDVVSKFKLRETVNSETFEDFGGLQDVVARAKELIEVRLKHKELLAKIGARPIKGVLFTGAPGTGKTKLARIVANSADSMFYPISGPEVFSKWYGESEKILRELFEDAAKQERAIVFFDEIDSVASQRAEESHEASRRVVAQLLALMDGFTADNNVVIIAATNRPEDIDVALRRPGRFDWEIYFHLPNRDDRESILRSSVRHLSTIDPLPHALIAENTESWSAADLAAIWSEAALLAASDGRPAIIDEDYVGGFERVSAQRSRVVRPSSGGNSA